MRLADKNLKMAEQIKIVLADDHPVVRQGLKQIIESDPRLKIVAQTGDGETALQFIEKLQPDVAVLDIDMPKMDGFAVVREMRGRKIEIPVIFLTMHDEEEIFQAALDLDVLGYVLKDSAETDIVESIESVARRRPFFSNSMSALLLKRRQRSDEFERDNKGLSQLTPTERRILKLIADNKTSKEIADLFYISHRTVDTHRTNISRKLNLQGSLALIKFAAAHKSEL